MLYDYNHTVSDYSTIDLDSNDILAGIPKLLNLEVLLEPLEEQFYTPTIMVKFCDEECRKYKIVR